MEEKSGPAEDFEVVHARILRFFPELVEELGGDLRDLLQQSGLEPGILCQGEPEVSYRQMVHLIELAATELRCSDLGMRLASLQSGSMFGPLGLAMRNSRTFGDALDYVCKHSYAHSLAAHVWLRRFPAVKHVFVGHDILLDRIPNKSQAMEQLLLVGHLAAMELTGGRARVRRVHFRHQPVSPLPVYRRYFGCDVHFGQNEDGVTFSERDLICPIIDPDAKAYEAVTAFIDREFTRHHPPLHAQTRGLIMQRVWSGECSNERIAADLNLHPRTLHRRLKAEGTSFQQIKDEVRGDIMLYYLQQTDLDFAAISEKLGFAEQSVMTRSCNRWFAASPTRVRAGQRSSTELDR
ncbi:AraC family transcriptional regulator [Sphingomonas cavernae]|uniref:AraC family transcriptional regulator n=1 Tax=Sphingomonas cavernae TaxID=2320861 RepID=A0A418WNN1_9SPHN|nr:AraC family transcriptional regulator [Sphingomonas cavernae]